MRQELRMAPKRLSLRSSIASCCAARRRQLARRDWNRPVGPPLSNGAAVHKYGPLSLFF